VVKFQYNPAWFRLAYFVLTIHFPDTQHRAWLLGANAQKQKRLTPLVLQHTLAIFLLLNTQYFCSDLLSQKSISSIPLFQRLTPDTPHQQEERKSDRVHVYFVHMNLPAMCANALVLKKKILTLCATFSDNLLLCCNERLVLKNKSCIVDTGTGNKSLGLPLPTVSAEPRPAEPEGLLHQKQQLQWVRRELKHQPPTGLLCLTAAPFPSAGKGQKEPATVEISQNCCSTCAVKPRRTAVFRGIKAAQWRQTQSC